MGVPETVKVWRAHDPDVGALDHEYTSAALTYEQAQKMARDLYQGHGVVSPLYIKRGDIVGVGQTGEHEVIVKTEHAGLEAPAPTGEINVPEMSRDMEKAASDYYTDPAHADAVNKHWRTQITPDKKTVLPAGVQPGPDDARAVSRDDALAGMSRATASALRGLFLDKNGKPIEKVLEYVEANGSMPTPMWLAKHLNAEELPRQFANHAYAPHFSALDKMTSAGFRGIGNAINFISRQKIFLHEMAKAIGTLEDNAGYKALAKTNPEAAETWLRENADIQARRSLEGMLHDPDQRSIFAQLHRSSIPFAFAQEQFVKRWVKTFFRDPSAMRRAQLMSHGLRSMGIFQPVKDNNGNPTGEDMFVYPGSHLFLQTINDTINRFGAGKNPLFGVKIPLPVDMTGQVKYLIPGVQGGAMPSFGPLVGLGATAVATLFPETKDYANFITGNSGGTGFWEPFVPTWMKNLIKTASTGADVKESTAQMQSAIFESLAMLQANPKTALYESFLMLPDGSRIPNTPENAAKYPGITAQTATPNLIQEQRDRAVSLARRFLALRAVFGFLAPSSPQLQYTKSLSPEWQQLLAATGNIQEASTAFLSKHPDGSLYETFASHPSISGLGTEMPATQAVGDWIKGNQSFIDKYGAASIFFMPWNPGNFDPTAYSKEIAEGFRIKRNVIDANDPDSIWSQAQINADAPLYYKTEHSMMQIIAGLKGQDKKDAQSAWTTWKANYLISRPIFSAYVNEAAARGSERQLRLDAVQKALADPSTPDTPQVQQIKVLMNAYTGVQNYLESIKNQRTSDAAQIRHDLPQALADFAATLEDGPAKSLYYSLIAPQFPGA
jgi:hypothetical protein